MNCAGIREKIRDTVENERSLRDDATLVRHIAECELCRRFYSDRMLDRRLSRTLKEMPEMIFTTAFYMTLDAATGRAAFASAGHPRALLLPADAGAAEYLMRDTTGHGPALALYPETTYTPCSRILRPGDRVIMCTDGLFEACNPAGAAFGEARLKACLDRNRGAPSANLLGRILDD